VEIHTYSGLSWSSTWQLDCKQQLMAEACHFECDLHPPEIHCTILQSSTWCLIQVFVGESTAVRNKMLDPSICWRIDQWTRSLCEWSSFQSVHGEVDQCVNDQAFNQYMVKWINVWMIKLSISTWWTGSMSEWSSFQSVHSELD